MFFLPTTAPRCVVVFETSWEVPAMFREIVREAFGRCAGGVAKLFKVCWGGFGGEGFRTTFFNRVCIFCVHLLGPACSVKMFKTSGCKFKKRYSERSFWGAMSRDAVERAKQFHKQSNTHGHCKASARGQVNEFSQDVLVMSSGRHQDMSCNFRGVKESKTYFCAGKCFRNCLQSIKIDLHLRNQLQN